MNSENINNIGSANSNEVSLKELILGIQEWWRYLLSRWLIIGIFGMTGGGLGFAYAYLNKPIYTATTTFVLEEEKSGSSLGGLAGLASMAGVDLGGSGGGIFQGDNILSLYKSRSIIERTLLTEVIGENQSKELLIDRYIDFNQLRKKWANKQELVNLKFSQDSLKSEQFPKRDRLRDSILGEIVDNINKNYLSVTKPDKKLSTIQVDVKSQDEFFAKSFNDELVKNVNEFYINTKTKKTLQNVQILQHKTDSVRAVMNGAIYSAVEVADATPNLNPTRQVQRVAPAQRAQFSAETNKSILAEMVKNLEMVKISLLKETPLIQLIDQPVYPLKREFLGKVKGAILGCVIFSLIVAFLLLATNIIKKLIS